ncbi:hypothetical protein [Sphaerisporangium rhizosphaerae]|uniref:DNA-binding protein n=1 Tax=Sphaerisporangium rhizosphaerae TaxID=2269375 RepID=A0ABW2P3I2_9ACTN
MTAPDGPPVVVPPALAEPIWRTLRAALARHRADGGHLAPGLAELLDELRAAALAHTLAQASGHRPLIPADIGSSCDQVHTDRLAGLLGVTPRHARRVARAAGYHQPRRGWWLRADVDHLIADRRR